jgi:DNA-binding response OmpR family regulator
MGGWKRTKRRGAKAKPSTLAPLNPATFACYATLSPAFTLLLVFMASSQGSVATREEIVDRLRGRDVFVDTEHGVNTAIRKIRQTLLDEPQWKARLWRQ